ncbi:hypothetical protein [Patulibacter defluvii]|uniref:hypothetical protein n=1 Tax=Patulibacter defluvii TaxID=3095358 RepID=UPI002A765235|nr:hypothetical protein [Patulibacter sp. DM4]
MPRILLPITSAPLAVPLVRTTEDGALAPLGDRRLDPVDERTLAWAADRRAAGEADHVAAVTVGGADADGALREAAARGATTLTRVAPPAAAPDLVAVARLLAAVAAARDDLAVLALGDESSVGSSGALPGAAAAALGWPLVARAREARLDGGRIVAERAAADGTIERLEAPLPVVLSLADDGRPLRAPRLSAVIAARTAPIEVVPGDPDAAAGSWPAAPLKVVPGPVRERARRRVAAEAAADELLALVGALAGAAA